MNNSCILNLELFRDISEAQINQVLQDLHGYQKQYRKGACIFHTGDFVSSMGIVLIGNVSVIQRDVWGKENIFHQIEEGGMFGETYAYVKDEPLMVDVFANCDSEILFMDIHALWKESMNTTDILFARNLTRLLAQKNLHLSRKIVHISPRTIRERLLSYLQDQSVKQKSTKVHVPFTRQQLADYLCVDRSALSHEISKLQKMGKLKITKQEFQFL